MMPAVRLGYNIVVVIVIAALRITILHVPRASRMYFPYFTRNYPHASLIGLPSLDGNNARVADVVVVAKVNLTETPDSGT